MTRRAVDALGLLVCFGLSVGLRLLELPKWRLPQMRMPGGEYLLNRPDAYGWLSAATGELGAQSNQLMWWLAAHGGRYLPVADSTMFLCAPALLACLVVLPTYWLTRQFGGDVLCALLAGVAVSLSGGFLMRTRVGDWDTDLLTLTLPLFLVACLARVGAGGAWLGQPIQSDRGRKPSWRVPYSLIVACFAAGVYVHVYPSGLPLILAILVLACVVWAFRAPAASWRGALSGFAVLLLALIQPLAAVGMVLGASLARRLGLNERRISWAVVVAAMVACLLGSNEAHLTQSLASVQRAVASIIQGQIDVEAGQALELVNIHRQGIEELVRWPLISSVAAMSANGGMAAISLLLFALTVLKRPNAVLLVPMLAVGLLSITIGNRFAMYGAPALAIGLGVGLSVTREMLGLGRHVVRGLALLAIAVHMAFAVQLVAAMAVGPIVDVVRADAYHDLRALTEADEELWDSWADGYAASYFSGRRSFLNGGRTQPERLFAAGRALAARSVAETVAEVRRFKGVADWDAVSRHAPLGSGDPLRFARDASAPWRRAWLSRSEGRLAPSPRENVLLVVSWAHLWKSGGTTLSYGRQPLGSQASGPPIDWWARRAQSSDLGWLSGTVKLNGAWAAVDSITAVYADSGSERRVYRTATGLHVVYNTLVREMIVMGESESQSSLIRMLIDPPGREAGLELVIDRAPWIRVYRVTPGEDA